MTTSSNLKDKVYRFISNNRAAALATVGKDGTPHVAIVYCVVFKDLSLYFMTRVEARKFTNLLFQPKIAMTFYNDDDLETVQLTGIAERVEDLRLEHVIWSGLMRFRTPWADKGPIPAVQLFERGATKELAIIKVKPTELTYASFTPNRSGRYKTFFEKVI